MHNLWILFTYKNYLMKSTIMLGIESMALAGASSAINARRCEYKLIDWFNNYNLVREGFKKNVKKRSGWPLGGGSPHSSLTASILWKFWPILSFIKWQNNPKYDNLSGIFYIFLTASGEGGRPKRSAWPLFPSFFLTPSLRRAVKSVLTLPNIFIPLSFLVCLSFRVWWER